MRWRRPLLVGIASVSLVGCAGTRQPQTPTPGSSYDFTREGVFPPTPAVDAAPPATAVGVEERPAERARRSDTAPPVATPAPAWGTVQGWRVQVFAGASEAAAQQVAGELRSAFPIVVYIDFVEPYYKVRLGDCPSRADCESLRSQVQGRGWTTAWVVPSAIQR